MRIAAWVPAALAVGALLGCGGDTASTPSDRVVHSLQNRHYGRGDDQTYDLYWTGRRAAAPIVVVVHYGAGLYGDKADYTPAALGTRLARDGFATASINYRLAPRHVWPAAVDDVHEAIRYFGRRYGTVFVIGLSAGGWFSEQAALTPPRPSGIISVAALHDASAFKQPWPGEVLAGADAKRASPLQNVGKGFPPILLLHGDMDPIVPFGQSTRMRDVLKSKGVEVEFVRLRGASHFSPERKFLNAFYPHVISWLRRHS